MLAHQPKGVFEPASPVEPLYEEGTTPPSMLSHKPKGVFPPATPEEVEVVEEPVPAPQVPSPQQKEDSVSEEDSAPLVTAQPATAVLSSEDSSVVEEPAKPAVKSQVSISSESEEEKNLATSSEDEEDSSEATKPVRVAASASSEVQAGVQSSLKMSPPAAQIKFSQMNRFCRLPSLL